MRDIRWEGSTVLALSILVVGLALFGSACGGGEAEVTLATGRPEAAEQAPTATPAVAQDAEAASELLEAAAGYYAEGEYEKAIAELEKAVELGSDNAEAYSNLALSYFQNGDYEDAIAAWSEVIDLQPDDAAAYYERATSYFNLKEYGRAIDDLTHVIQIDPGDVDAFRVRGKAYAFLEDYEQAIEDFTRTIELDPAAAEAYLNRAVALSKIGSSRDDLAAIIADAGMVLQIGGDREMLQQARDILETLLENSDDPTVRQQAADALGGQGATSQAPALNEELSLMDVDINRAPGNSIGFEDSLEPGEAHRFLFLASPGDTVSAGIASVSDMRVGIQNTETGEILGVAPSNDNSLFVTIPENQLYHVVIEDAGGQGGDYVAALEGSPRVSFALAPRFFIIGRLPEGGLLYYTYTGPGGATLQGNVIPHPDTPVDLVVAIRELESQQLVFEANESGPGENERFAFTLPDSGDGRLLTYIVSIEDVDRAKGAYALTTASDAEDVGAASPASPEGVVQAVFDAAQSGDFSALEGLCDPLGENDGDTQMICDVATEDANWDEFLEYFAAGRVSGEAQISPGGDSAEVPILFGPDGDQEETMTMINRDGRWYLFSF
jgi:tetratricopeptide (TPR) repeat protein